MMLPTSRAPGVTIVFGCMRRKGTCSEPNCGGTAKTKCQAPLRGKKAGQVCGRDLCGAHGDRCGPHHRAGA